MQIMGSLLAIVRGLMIIVSMIVYMLIYAATRIVWSHSKESGFKLRRLWIRSVGYPVLNLHVHMEGQVLPEPALYVCNHRSFSDPLIISRYLDANIIAKAEVGNYPIINKAADLTGIIYVERENKSSRSKARSAFVDVIRSGYNILVYPEGTISTDRGIKPFKKGTFYESAAQGITVVPVALEYRDDRDLWTVANFVKQYIKQFSKWRTEAKLSFGPPIKSQDGDAILQHCESWISQEIDLMQQGWSRVDFDNVVKDY